MYQGTRALLVILLLLPAWTVGSVQFRSQWSKSIDRVWPGPEYWSNPLQDWRVANGRLECVVSGGDRNVCLLTREIGSHVGDLRISVRFGRLEEDGTRLTEGWVGLRIGLRGHFNDYRDTAVRGEGLNAGMTTGGRLFIGKLDPTVPTMEHPFGTIDLRLTAEPVGNHYRVRLAAFDESGTRLSGITRDDVKADWLVGGIALACSAGEFAETPAYQQDIPFRGWRVPPEERRGGNVRFWFSDWKLSGSKLVSHEERAFGPILFAHHTLSRGILKLTAQMAPVGNNSREVLLQIRQKDEDGWRTIAKADIDSLARTATFRVADWDTTTDTRYRLAYALQVTEDESKECYFEGTIRRDPVDKEKITVAAFTGNHDFGFPQRDIVDHVRHFDPDVLVFTGDQIYEPVGGYGIQREPVDVAALDYLRKWYIYGWAFRVLFKDRPTVCLIDDHDVYHGNIWGAGGRATSPCGPAGQDLGGYCMHPDWVKMVHRVQTSHLPDPYDSAPAEQDIPVYYTEMLYGGVSFAIVEDRKWKSAPKVLLAKAEIRNGWAQNPQYEAARDGDVAGAVLLGQRQLEFLENWAADWTNNTWMKVVLSQTLFANVATLPKEATSDAAVRDLSILEPGEYAEGDKLVQDHDSNGWPQSGRNRALRLMRKAFAIHIAGDQHLGSTVQYGADDWNDAGFAICVPSVSNIFPRRWFPPKPGQNHIQGTARYTGEYEDGFGNRITVHAVSNPEANGIEPTALNHRAPGYGIITLDRADRKITFTNWPRWVDPAQPGAKPYAGWPVTFDQTDNYKRKPIGYLPAIEVIGIQHPVVQVIREPGNEIVYTLRIQGNAFTPRVFEQGTYALRVGEPGTTRMKTIEGLRPGRKDQAEPLMLEFQ